MQRRRFTFRVFHDIATSSPIQNFLWNKKFHHDQNSIIRIMLKSRASSWLTSGVWVVVSSSPSPTSQSSEYQNCVIHFHRCYHHHHHHGITITNLAIIWMSQLCQYVRWEEVNYIYKNSWTLPWVCASGPFRSEFWSGPRRSKMGVVFFHDKYSRDGRSISILR